jgi:FkbM family methyltransferase
MFVDLYQRISHYSRAARLIVQSGGTVTSGLLYPFRRRSLHDPRCQIDFRNKTSIAAPSDFPLLNLIEEIWIRQCYTSKNVQIQPGATIVDIGANVGVFCVLLAAANPQAKIIAVEPGHENLEFLYRNITANHLHNIFVVPAACSGVSGEATLYGRTVKNPAGLTKSYSHGTLHSLFCRDVYGSEFIPLHQTNLVTLGNIFAKFGVTTCDLLKLDCEGAEYDILLNASKDTLQRVSKISMEYHVGFNDHSIERLQHVLESYGFQVDRLPMGEDDTGFLYASNGDTNGKSLACGV